MRLGPWVLLGALGVACETESTQFTDCERLAFKERFCGATTGEYPNCDNTELTETDRCRIACFAAATCEELVVGNLDSDTGACLAECGGGRFRCGDGTSISSAWRCDGSEDCADGSDEQNCGGRRLSEDFFDCDDGGRVPLTWVCDDDPDCADGSDEAGCDGRDGGAEFVCDNAERVPADWVCDDIEDCTDGSDEASCA